eukprot:TRINITY_DN4359_c0_g1_i1.p1 TRINITY_DN4359_c0_g1~~TRINITY_DN4359_c0_g1_i1.p1  ORF type:complete len:1519 (-),score=257.83 TRINITY_DN4359_c0_g1_i1:120-4676(-)
MYICRDDGWLRRALRRTIAAPLLREGAEDVDSSSSWEAWPWKRRRRRRRPSLVASAGASVAPEPWTRRRRWRLSCAKAAAACLSMALPQPAVAFWTTSDGERTYKCRVEEGMCFGGPNLNIDFSNTGSSVPGCRELPSLDSCCELCVQYWPQCQSFQFIYNGNANNGYPGQQFHCCLKPTLRPDPQPAPDPAFLRCDSGYQNPKCVMTNGCETQVYGNGLTANDHILIGEQDDLCGSGSMTNWTGLDNPAQVRNVAPYNNYDMGAATDGPVGNYRLCYRQGPSDDLTTYATPVGMFTMGGPTTGQHLSCTLAAECIIELAGFGFAADPSRYRIVIIHNVVLANASNPCDSASSDNLPTLEFWRGLENPDQVEDDVTDTKYRLGLPLSGNTVDDFAICWADYPAFPFAQIDLTRTDTGRYSGGHFPRKSETVDSTVQFGLEMLAEYTVFVGLFSMNGPSLTGGDCTMGQPCKIYVQGRGLSVNNALMIVYGDQAAMCGLLVKQAVIIQQFNNPVRVVNNAPYDVFDFGTPLDHAPGPEYRLCWASEPTVVYSVHDFLFASQVDKMDYLIDMGTFTLNGPQGGSRTCTLTMPCAVSLVGSGLALTDGLYIIKPGAAGVCGDPSPEQTDVDGADWVNPGPGPISVAGDGTSEEYFYGTPISGTPFGGYLLCWGARVSAAPDYMITLGGFTLAGPIASPGISCTKGENCIIILTGFGLETSNWIFVGGSAADCGNETPTLADFSPMSVNMQVPADGVAQNKLSSEYRMGIPVFGTASETWMLCWAHDPSYYSGFSGYKFAIGDFAMVGANYLDQECTLSIPCNIVINGALLQATNRILLIKGASQNGGECGDNLPPYADFAGVDPNFQVTNNAPYNLYELGIPTQGIPSTDYRLCWSHAPSIWQDPSLYRAIIGLLTVYGPDQVDRLYCTLSVPCNIQLTGIGLEASNQLQIIKMPGQCGDPDVGQYVEAWEGITNPSRPVSGDVSYYEMGTAATGVPSDNYWLCWGHAPTTAEEHRVPLAKLRLSGPDVLTAYKECILGMECSLTLTGLGMESTNHIAVIEYSDPHRCGQGALPWVDFTGMPNPALVADGNSRSIKVFPLGLPTFVYRPGLFTICWSHTGARDEDYDVNVGTLRMAGPVPAVTSCTMSEPCHIMLDGVRLSPLFSKVLIIKKPSLCGDANPIVPQWGGARNPAPSLTFFTPATPLFLDGDGYNALTPKNDDYEGKPSARFSLCWAYNPPGGDGASAYKVPVGDFIMNGPHQGVDISCILGVQCNIKITGWGLFYKNQVMIVSGDGDCGTADVTQAVLNGIKNPEYVTNDEYTNLYPMGLVTVGGSYALCRTPTPAESCIGSHYQLCWANGVNGDYTVYPPVTSPFADFNVKLGKFGMSGPFVTYQVDCTLGQECSFKIYGTNLRVSNGLLLITEHSQCGDKDPIVGSIAGLKNPVKVSEVDAALSEATFRLGIPTGGSTTKFRICWGFDPVVYLQYNIEVGPLAFTPPSDLCVVEDGLTLSCKLPENDGAA